MNLLKIFFSRFLILAMDYFFKKMAIFNLLAYTYSIMNDYNSKEKNPYTLLKKQRIFPHNNQIKIKSDV